VSAIERAAARWGIAAAVAPEGVARMAQRPARARPESDHWAPDASIKDRVERLARERAERCARGQHEDPDNSGLCINCSADLDPDDAS
jgi:hypothetical protein